MLTGWKLFAVALVLVVDMIIQRHLFALNMSPFSSGVETADQYRWFTSLLFHSPTSSQSFSYARESTFFLKAVGIYFIFIIIAKAKRLILPSAKCRIGGLFPAYFSSPILIFACDGLSLGLLS